MKCSKCGAELSEGTKFCSYCGEKVEKIQPETNNHMDEETTYSDYDDSEILSKGKEGNSADKTDKVSEKIKRKCKQIWNQSSIYEKFYAIFLVIFTILCLIAFIAGKPLAGVMALLSVITLVTAWVMDKKLLSVHKRWLSTAMIVLALTLLLPYFFALAHSGSNSNDAQKISWSDIVMGDILPNPDSDLAEIYSNTEELLSIDIYEIKESQFKSYVKACSDKGFVIEAEQLKASYNAFNQGGYELNIEYDEDEEKMSIHAEAPVKLVTLKWPDNEMTKLIPVPKSTIGNITMDDETGFSAIIGETSLKEYGTYVQACIDKGFIVEVSQAEKEFSAMNSERFRLSVQYIGNNRMQIDVKEPEYDIKIEVKCVENLMFSKYDVDVLVDDEFEGTLEHGGKDSYSLTVNRGSHVIRFESEEDDSIDGETEFEATKQNETFKFEIYCTSSQIDVENLAEKETQDQPEKNSDTDKDAQVQEQPEENLTADNCPELATILYDKTATYKSYAAFAAKYAGRVIEFDGSTDYCATHDKYTTRFDYLLSSGDYDPNHQIGPTFKFENVNYNDLHTDLETVNIGLNVHIIARVVSFDYDHGIFYLKPVSVTRR